MNKKKTFAFLLVCLLVSAINAQDKIITNQGDTISCKILSISATHINYEQRNGQAIVGKFIPIDRVSEYSRNGEGVYQNLPEKPAEYAPEKRADYNRWRVGVQIGAASLLGSARDDKEDLMETGVPENQAEDYVRSFNTGFQFGCDLHGMFNQNVGLGLKYQFYHTSASTGDYQITNGWYYGIPNYYIVSVSDNVYINYIGVSVVLQQWLDRQQRFAISGQFSLGCAFYREEMRFKPLSNVLGTKNIPAATLELSADYYILKWLSVGAGVEIFGGKVRDIEIKPQNSGAKPDDFSIWRMDYSLSTKFHF